MWDEVIYYSRMALGIRDYLRTPPLADPEAVIRRQLASREAIFLDTVRRVIFSNPRNPYHEMFRLAGCTFEDLAQGVAKDGLEATLALLNREGVFLTHDEFKGKVPIVRSGREIPARTASFRNPLVAARIEGLSSGSRSKGTRTPRSKEYQLYMDARCLLHDRELGLTGRTRIEVKPILPSSSGWGSCLRAHRLGYKVDRWFAVGGTWRSAAHYSWLTRGMILLGNALGAGAPYPRYLPQNDFAPVTEWVARHRASGASCVVNTCPSPAARIAAAALDKGLDIRGTVFLLAGEALTDAKREILEKAGAEAYIGYPITEAGLVGFACRQMKNRNCVHLFKEGLAVIGHRQRVPLSETEVDALLFTTLLPIAGNVLINAEMGDSGVIEPARCDCLYSRLGFSERVRDISSYGKLTGQGMTLVGTDLVRILEKALPAQLGGVSGDYQLVEQEGKAQTQVILRVNPRLGVLDPVRIRECFLREIQNYYGGSLAARTWRHADGVGVVIGEPYTTVTGKVPFLHLIGSGTGRADAA